MFDIALNTEAGGRLNIKMSFYWYRNFHVKDRLVFNMGNTIPGMPVLILKRDPGSDFCFVCFVINKAWFEFVYFMMTSLLIIKTNNKKNTFWQNITCELFWPLLNVSGARWASHWAKKLCRFGKCASRNVYVAFGDVIFNKTLSHHSNCHH